MPRFERKTPKPATPPDALPKIERALGLVGVRKLACRVLQQQLESLKDRKITAEDREFVIEAVKALVAGEKVQRAPGKTGDAHGTALPALEAKT